MRMRRRMILSMPICVVMPRLHVLVNMNHAGDVIEVSVWEAPPAMLFGSTTDVRMTSSTAKVTSFPEQMVSSEGAINIPFVGHIPVAGHTPQWIEEEVAQRLKGKANQPQILVRVIRNATATVTVIGATERPLARLSRGRRRSGLRMRF